MEESESESVISLSSKQSYLQSERSVDSGYKSNPEERDEFQENIFGKVKLFNISSLHTWGCFSFPNGDLVYGKISF